MTQEHHTTPSLPAGLSTLLLRWYRENARDLPWRRTNDPYRVWVSEIMLQQTRVAAALGYYARFIEEFPSVGALASAPEERLLKLWEGLGYYTRAKNMQKAARLVTESHGGSFPDNHAALLTLPGVGDYTASAIASAVFGRREPAVDGNVLRVVARLTDCNDDVTAPKIKADIRARVLSAMPTEADDIRLFNQALMELGALVCVPNGSPKCALCPVSALCLGKKRGTAEILPVKTPKKARRVEHKTVFVLLQGGKIALRKRPSTGLLAALWEFPNVDGTLDEATAAAQLSAWGLAPKAWKRQLSAKHIFTHVEWHMTGYSLEVSGANSDDFFWADAGALECRAVPSAFAKFLVEANAELCPRA